MRINKFAVLAGLAVASTLVSGGAAWADEADQATKFTFSQAVEIPGKVLPAGTYMFKVDPDNLNTIRVFDADGRHLYAIVQTISAVRLERADNTVVSLAKPAGETPELVKWFYPGRTTGHEFVYSTHQEQQLAQERQQTIEVKGTAVSGD